MSSSYNKTNMIYKQISLLNMDRIDVDHISKMDIACYLVVDKIIKKMNIHSEGLSFFMLP